MKPATGASILLFMAAVAMPRPALSFLPPTSTTLARSGSVGASFSSSTRRMAASDTGSDISRKEKSREQVRNLLKGLGELDDDDAVEETGVSDKAKKRDARKALKDQVKLDPEVVFFEGAPHWSEAVVPAISVLTVIGIIPFAGSMARQIWCRYKITSRRVSVASGVGGKDLTEVIYPDIAGMAFVFRAFGVTGDMVLFLRDGAKLEMRSIPNFREVYNYIRSNLEPDALKNAPELPILD